MYRLTRKARLRRKWRPTPDPPGTPRDAIWQPPLLRRRVTIEDFDGVDPRTHVIELYRTNRIDSYRAVIDGKPWRTRAGWSAVLDGLRRAMPRIASQRR